MSERPDSPKILALETSSIVGSVALLDGERILQEITLEQGLKHGTLLMPAAQECLQKAGMRPSDLDAVAVSAGPGSYTGTRIGVMAGKALAYGAGKSLLAVSSLAGLAWDARTQARYIVPVQDARRDEVYTAVYHLNGDTLETVEPDRALTPEEAVALAQGEDYVLLGTALTKYPELFAPNALPAGTRLCEGVLAPSAGAIGILGARLLAAGETVDPLVMQPTYLRREDAPTHFEKKAMFYGSTRPE